MSARASLRVVLAVMVAAASAVPLGAQSPGGQAAGTHATTTTMTGTKGDSSLLGNEAWQMLRGRLTGEMLVTSEMYAQQGAQNRLPAEAWTMSFSPRMELVGGITVGIDALLSSQGNQLRQNINQLGLNPHWSWGTAHLGDFTHGLSQFTTQGIRVRGLGLDLNPGALRFSLQAGQTQRSVVGGLAAGPVYARNMMAARLGVGRESGSYLDLEVVKVKDNPNSAGAGLVIADTLAADTLFNDTIPSAFRPRPQTEKRPQENLVSALVGQLTLFRSALRMKGSLAGSLITGDETSGRVASSALGRLRMVNGLMPIRLSTSGDVAYNLESDLSLPDGGLHGTYAYMGPGYTSLGLGYVMNDQRQYSLGGDVSLIHGLVSLQGQYDHQNDNLLGQKLATTNRNVITGSVAVRAGAAVTTSLTAMTSLVANDAPVDTFMVHNQVLSLSTSTAIVHHLRGLPAVALVTYAYQGVTDASGIAPAPAVRVHDLSLSEQLSAGRGMSFAPTLSGVFTQTAGSADQRNIFAGFRGQGKFLDGKLRPTASVSQSFTNGRRIFAVRTQTSYTLPTGVRLVIATRFTSYSAYGSRRAFQETFLTTTLGRSF